MINVFISSLIALFFLGKTSKETREKTARASWFRTIVYLFLTVIFGFVFYKSNQVSTIVNIVELRCLRGTEDSLHNPLDTIMYIDIYNNFKTMGSYKNEYNNLQNKYTDEKHISEYGGVYASMKRKISDQDRIITREELIKSSKYEPFNDSINKYLGKDISQLGSIYELSLLTTNIPNFIPLFPVTELPLSWVCSDDGSMWFSFIAKNSRNNNFLNVSIDGESNNSVKNKIAGEKIWDNGSFFQLTSFFSDINMHRYFEKFEIYGINQLANTINFLTAADLSQYSYIVSFRSDMPVKCINVKYNIPIELTNVGEGFSVGANYFTLYHQDLTKVIREGYPLYFHVKLPTMANLQEIRSLVLTALVTTFFSLFCTNLFFCLRKRAMKYRLLHLQRISSLKRISRKRLTFYRYFHYMLVLILLSFILFVVCMSCYDITLMVNFDYIEYKIAAIVLLITSALLFASYRLYIYTITPLPKKRGKEKIKEREDNKNK